MASRLAIAVALTLGLVSQANAVGLKPLTEILADDTSDATLIHTIKRCSAAYMAMASAIRVTSEGSADQAALAARAQETAGNFFNLALQFGQDHGISADAEALADEIGNIAKLYIDEMNVNYFATGNRLAGTVAADIEFCRRAAEG